MAAPIDDTRVHSPMHISPGKEEKRRIEQNPTWSYIPTEYQFTCPFRPDEQNQSDSD